MANWAFASPLGASPDDDYHMPSIWCGEVIHEGFCEAGDTAEERKGPKAPVVSSLFVAVTTALLLLLPAHRRGAFEWGGLVAIVPLGMFLITSVNPSSWAVLSAHRPMLTKPHGGRGVPASWRGACVVDGTNGGDRHRGRRSRWR